MTGPRRYAGRLKHAVLGHTSGLIHSIACESDLRRRQLVRRVAVDRTAAAGAALLRRDGVLAVPTNYSSDLVAYLQAAVELTEDAEVSHAMGAVDPEAVRYVEDPLKHASRLAELLTPEILAVVRAWYRTEFQVSSVRKWRIAHVDADDFIRTYHYGNLWHQDGHSLNTLKLFIQTTPGAAQDGSALRYVSRRQSRRAFLAGYNTNTDISAAAFHYLESSAGQLAGPPGSAMLVDTNRCLHRAGNPAIGRTRGMVQFMFDVADSAPLGGDYLAHVPKDPNVYEGARV